MASAAPFFFIVNPHAGFGGRRFSPVAARLRQRGVPFAAAMTTGPGDARVLAQLARRGKFGAIVCVGGDGTVNEVVNGLATPAGRPDQRTVLGLIPSGTAQDFAKGAGIPRSPSAAVDRLLAGLPAPVDVGRIRFRDGRVHLFVNALGVGFDAEVAERAQPVRGAMSSVPAHLFGFASALAVYQNKEISIAFEDGSSQPARFRCNMVVAANGPSYAGVFRLAPAAVLDDGLLDVVVFGDIDRIEFLLHLARAFAGTHLDYPKVAMYRVSSFSLDSDEEALVQADGDVVGHLPARVDVLPRALRIIR